MFVERLQSSLKEKPPIVVGIDPDLSRLQSQYPHWVKKKLPSFSQSSLDIKSIASLYWDYSKMIIDAVYDLVPVVKPQSAFFEVWGHEGVAVLEKVITYAQSRGLLVIADIKRGDVPTTAEMYAQAYLDPSSPLSCDAITLNPYLGIDSLIPYCNRITPPLGKGVFVLLKTSNLGSGNLQDLMVGDKKLYEHLASLLNEQVLSLQEAGLKTSGGYSNMGVVVGATYPEAAKRLRNILPHSFFLVPGLGAQGGDISLIKEYLNPDGLGALFSFSRSIIYPIVKMGEDHLLPQNIREVAINHIKQIKQSLS